MFLTNWERGWNIAPPIKQNTMQTETLENAKAHVDQNGFLDVELDPTLDLFAEIEKLKKQLRVEICSNLIVSQV